MNRFFIALLISLFTFAALAETPDTKTIPQRIGTTADFKQLLLATKWSWRNVVAGVPDRECVFMPDGTFRHPNFVAKFTIKDINVVELTRKGGKAVMTFDKNYTSFEAIDFQNKRITGKRP